MTGCPKIDGIIDKGTPDMLCYKLQLYWTTERQLPASRDFMGVMIEIFALHAKQQNQKKCQ